MRVLRTCRWTYLGSWSTATSQLIKDNLVAAKLASLKTGIKRPAETIKSINKAKVRSENKTDSSPTDEAEYVQPLEQS